MIAIKLLVYTSILRLSAYVLHEVDLNITYQGGPQCLVIYPTFYIASRRPKFKPEMTGKTFRCVGDIYKYILPGQKYLNNNNYFTNSHGS